MTWNQIQMKSLRDDGKKKNCFHHCKSVPDALTRTTTIRKICKFGIPFDEIILPTIWMKSHRIFEEPRIAMYHPLANEDSGAFSNRVSADLTILQAFTAESVSGRI